MPTLSQLVLLSVSAAVTVNFENSVQDRINWLESVLSVLNPRVFFSDPLTLLTSRVLIPSSTLKLPKSVRGSWLL